MTAPLPLSRRQFLKTVPPALATAGIAAGAVPSALAATGGTQPPAGRALGDGHRVRYPQALQTGDRIAVVSPAGPVDVTKLEAGEAILRGWGLEPVEGQFTRARQNYLAGTDDQRAADLNAAFRDPEVRGIWISRGGYGVTRILELLDWDALAADPKAIVGFSDLTALLAAVWRRVGLVTVHGPMVERLPLLDDRTSDWVRRLVTAVDVPGPLPEPTPPEQPPETQPPETATAQTPETVTASPQPTTDPPPQSVVPGVVEGRLVGGNLSLLSALVGTPDQLDVSGKILLVEDVGETQARLDRMLTQLRAAGALAGVLGIAVGPPVNCAGVEDATACTNVFAERLGDLAVPLVTGLPVGHNDRQVALPHGALARLDAHQAVLELTEPAVRSRS